MKKADLKKIVIIHHQPLEIFPPVMNFINYLSTRLEGRDKLYVLTTAADLNFKKFENKEVSFKRIYKSSRRNGTFKRLYNFGLFAMQSVFYLLKWKPDAVVYYESHSALPVFNYYKYFRGNAKLFIHYHEYMTDAEYLQRGMRLVNYSHKKESYLYRIADWISHTNGKRMELFLEDHKYVRKEIARVLPNYPPDEWASDISISESITLPLKMVYIGSFGSTDDLYIKEILNWVKAKPEELMLDIYSFNVSGEVVNFVSELDAKNIRLFNSVDYDSLPKVLKGYHVGIILYKATSLNFKFNAPNKLFEYLALGMDVWFPLEMLGCYPYIRKDVYPKVISIDYNNLKDFQYREAISREGLLENRTDFFCETAYASLVDKLQAC